MQKILCLFFSIFALHVFGEPPHKLDLHLSKVPLNGKQESTLSIIKPDGVEQRHVGEIIHRFEKANLRIRGLKILLLSQEEGESFYQEHKGKPFFSELVKFMSSGPIVVIVLEGENAIAKNRELMGATDPKKAAPGTIRADFAQSIDTNTVHGSDSSEAARREIEFFFAEDELLR